MLKHAKNAHSKEANHGPIATVNVVVQVRMQLPKLLASSANGNVSDDFDDLEDDYQTLVNDALAEVDYHFGPHIDVGNTHVNVIDTEMLDDGGDDIHFLQVQHGSFTPLRVANA